MPDYTNHRPIHIRHKLNEGARIYTPKGHLDILVRKIFGTGKSRECILDMISSNGETLNDQHITYKHRNLEPIDNVFFHIRKGSRTSGSLLELEYFLPIKNYFLDKIIDENGEIKLKHPNKSIWLKKTR